MTKLDTANFNHILADFTYIVNLEFFTDRCGSKEYSRFEDIVKNSTKHMNFEEFLKKQENQGAVGPKGAKSPANKKPG
jgi:Ran GTPase-activating protein (RanGAP) involved in mRNA processing and transport